MPLFEYECAHCGTRFEQLVFSNDSQIACRNCGSLKITQMLSVFSVAAPQGKCAPESGSCTSCSCAQRGVCGMD